MYLVVGLGNPGSKYTFTYHNVGFLCIDYISQKHNIIMDKNKHSAILGKGTINNVEVLLAKPQTFMNLSGESVREIARFYKILPQNIVIIYDDISLDIGKIRIRLKGSAGGHNGIKSIACNLCTESFIRIRIGISKENTKMDLASYVLSKINDDEKEVLYNAMQNSCIALEYIVNDNIQKSMNEFN